MEDNNINNMAVEEEETTNKTSSSNSYWKHTNTKKGYGAILKRLSSNTSTSLSYNTPQSSSPVIATNSMPSS